MEKLTEIIHASSTNGRWGLIIVGPEGVDLHHPTEGALTALGKRDGKDIFQFTPAPGNGQWFYVGGDVKIIAGAQEVYSASLQSSSSVTVIVGGPFFALTEYGYKGRSARTTCYKNGQRINAPPPVLMAMGVLPCTPEPVKVEIPALDGPLAAALKAAGL